MKFYLFVFYISLSFVLVGCGEDEGGATASTAVSDSHFQGRDCLACHNVDLQQERNLLVGGTLFKNLNVSNVNNMSQNCGGDFVVEFLNPLSSPAIITSTDYENLNSKGYQGKGNIFMLSRILGSLNGDYYIRIKDRLTNITMAQSTTLHSFGALSYDLTNPADLSNRNSCNTCHQQVGQAGAAGFMYANVRPDLCK